MRLYFFLLFLLILIPLTSSYANLTPIPETPPTLTLLVEETFPPSTEDGGAAGGGAGVGAFGEGNVTGSVQDAINNETIIPAELQEKLDEEKEEKRKLFEEKEAKKNPDKEGSAAVTVDKNVLENSPIIPLIAIILVIGILITLVLKGKKNKKKELPQKA